MKRTSVKLVNQQGTYGKNIVSEKASAEVRRNAIIVPVAGLSLIGMLATFIISHI